MLGGRDLRAANFSLHGTAWLSYGTAFQRVSPNLNAPKFKPQRTHPRASQEKLKAPGKSLGPGQWTSILTSTHSSPSTPVSLIHRELRGPERAHFTFIFEFLPTWLILISPVLLPEEEEGGLAEQKETEQPSVRGHTWPQGHWKEVSLRE